MAFDGEKCIEILLNKSSLEVDRIAAAESLVNYPKEQTLDCLFKCVMDETDEEHIREEAAGVLGYLWSEMGIDYNRIVQKPTSIFNRADC